MEWWKLFSGTFFLIFLAELGDKTQLAALAKTADTDSSMGKWIVFIGASLALVASTFIAVFLGHILQSLIPDPRYIRIAAGGLFLVFGVMILYETYKSYQTTPETAAPGAVATQETSAASSLTFIGGLALKAAIDFESHAGARYRKLAASASSSLASLLLELAREEDAHLARLRNIPEGADGLTCPLPTPQAEKVQSNPSVPATLAELIRHEQGTADFYQALAERTVIPSARTVFARLAQEEKSHADRLMAIAETL